MRALLVSKNDLMNMVEIKNNLLYNIIGIVHSYLEFLYIFPSNFKVQSSPIELSKVSTAQSITKYILGIVPCACI